MPLILIVDDSPTEVHVMQKALEKHGYRTAAALTDLGRAAPLRQRGGRLPGCALESAVTTRARDV